MDPKFEKLHTDKRGSIYLLTGMLPNGQEINYLEMVKKSARGGCYHSNDEYFAVLRGSIVYVHGKTVPFTEELVSRGESRLIPAGEIHAFKALEDSLISEWGITTEEKKLDIKDPELRRLIDSINSQL